MIISIVSIIVILHIGWIVYKERELNKIFFKLLVINVFFATCIQLGGFIHVGDLELDYYIFYQFIVSLIGIFILSKRNINKKLFTSYLCFIIILLIGILLIAIFPGSERVATGGVSWDDYYIKGAYVFQIPQLTINNILEFIKTVSFLIIVMTSVVIFTNNDFRLLLLNVSHCMKFYVCYGIIEIICKVIFNSSKIQTIINFIFGVKDRELIEVLQYRNMRISGLTQEPSHYAYALLICILVFWAEGIIKNKKNVEWIILSLILMIVSGAFSSILFISYFFIVMLLYLITVEKNNWQKCIILLNIIFLSIILCYIGLINLSNSNSVYLLRFENVIFIIRNIFNGNLYEILNASYSSNVVRLVSVIETIKLFFKRPFLGWGIGTLNSHGSTASAIANLGIIGVYFILKIWLDGLYKFKNKKRNSMFIVSILMFWMINFLNSRGMMLIYSIGNIIIIISLQTIFYKNIYNEMIEV